MPSAPPPPGLSPLQTELRATAALAFPLALAFGGDQLVSLVDTAVAGRLGTVEIGAVGLGSTLFFFASVLPMGILLGLEPLAAQALGAGETHVAGQRLRESLWLALLLTVPAMILAWSLLGTLDWVGAEEATKTGTRAYLLARLPSMAPFLLRTALRSFLQAHDRARPVLIATVVANVMNLPANFLLARGDAALTDLGLAPWGLGEGLGVAGIGIASTLVAVVQVLMLWPAVRALPGGKPAQAPRPTVEGSRKIMGVGLPIGLHFCSEMGVFGTVTVLIGGMGAVSVGGHHVAIQLAAFTFTLALGVSAAASVRVGHAIGRGDSDGVIRAGGVALTLSTLMMGAFSVVFVVWPSQLARLLAEPPEIIAAAGPLLMVAAVFQIFDGGQITSAGMLRGAGDTRYGMRANLLGHWGVGMPVGAALGYGAEMGAVGLWWGLTAGLGVAAVLQARRFFVIGRHVRRL